MPFSCAFISHMVQIIHLEEAPELLKAFDFISHMVQIIQQYWEKELCLIVTTLYPTWFR